MEVGLRREIASVLNRHSMEKHSNTPDFILAKYLTNCLRAFDIAMQEREVYFNQDIKHESDCALHSEPAFPSNRCNCKEARKETECLKSL